MIEWHEMPAPPALPSLYLQAALRRKASGRPLPSRGLRCELKVDRQHLARYRELCGNVDEETLPPAYPHVLAFPLQMHLLTAADFPFPLLGLVHLQNRIRVYRSMPIARAVQVSVTSARLEPHPQGTTFDLIARLEDEEGLLWEAESRLLSRGQSLSRTSRERRSKGRAALHEVARWKAPASIGLAYARISGDYNPIHLSPLTSRLFGFDRPIAHGLWSKARVLAALSERLPGAGYEVEVRFHRPLVLPGEAQLLASDAGGTGQFMVRGANGKRYLEGQWSPLAVMSTAEPAEALALTAPS